MASPKVAEAMMKARTTTMALSQGGDVWVGWKCLRMVWVAWSVIVLLLPYCRIPDNRPFADCPRFICRLSVGFLWIFYVVVVTAEARAVDPLSVVEVAVRHRDLMGYFMLHGSGGYPAVPTVECPGP